MKVQILAFAVFLTCCGCDAPTKQSQMTTPPSSPSAAVPHYDAADIIAAARFDVKSGLGSSALNELSNLREGDTNFPGHLQLEKQAKRLAQVEKAREAKAHADFGENARTAYAHTLEDSMLKEYEDFYVRAQGPNHETLYVRYALMNRPFVYGIMNDEHSMGSIRSLGFKKIVFTNGYESTWTQRVSTQQ